MYCCWHRWRWDIHTALLCAYAPFHGWTTYIPAYLGGHSSHPCFGYCICAGTHRDVLIVQAGHVMMQMHCCLEVVTVSMFWRQLCNIICCIATSEMHSEHMIKLLKRVIAGCVMQCLLKPATQDVWLWAVGSFGHTQIHRPGICCVQSVRPLADHAQICTADNASRWTQCSKVARY